MRLLHWLMKMPFFLGSGRAFPMSCLSDYDIWRWSSEWLAEVWTVPHSGFPAKPTNATTSLHHTNLLFTYMQWSTKNILRLQHGTFHVKSCWSVHHHQSTVHIVKDTTSSTCITFPFSHVFHHFPPTTHPQLFSSIFTSETDQIELLGPRKDIDFRLRPLQWRYLVRLAIPQLCLCWCLPGRKRNSMVDKLSKNYARGDKNKKKEKVCYEMVF